MKGVGSERFAISIGLTTIAVKDGAVSSLDVKQDPEFFKLAIPEDFKVENLPLWQLIILPNENYGRKLAEDAVASLSSKRSHLEFTARTCPDV